MGLFGIGPSADSHEESTSSHWNVFGSTYEHTITESDGTTFSGWGWSASEASDVAQDSHDRDR